MRVHPASACLPGIPFAECVDQLVAGLTEPVFGAIDAAHIQLCPQTPGHLDEAACEALAANHPGTTFRLHANARVQPMLRLLDASNFNDLTQPYFEDLADRSRRLGASAYSLHAGYRRNATLAQTIDNTQRLADLFGVPVALEGLYPRTDRPQLMDSWADYETALRSGVPLAIDLSHLNIVQRAEGIERPDLVAELLAAPQTIEVHLSDNNGVRDDHRVTTAAPWWIGLLDLIHPNAIVFTEGNHLNRRNRPTPRSH